MKEQERADKIIEQILFTEKYTPKNLDEFIGNTEIVEEMKKWADSWEQGKIEPAVLLWGKTGAGKTTLATLIAKTKNWELFELNSSDYRSKDIIEKIVGSASENSSLFGKKRLILLDEIDCMQRQDRGGTAAIAKVLKESKNPIILTANNIYGDQKLSAIRTATKNLNFKKINYLSMAVKLREIAKKENIEFEPETIKELAKNSEGDMRAALLDLQTLGMKGKIEPEDLKDFSNRERQEDIFKVVSGIFNAKTIQEARDARNKAEINNDLLFLWMQENIPRQKKEGKDTAEAYEQLAKADKHYGRIYKRQNYKFLKYYIELMTTGVGLTGENKTGWNKLQFPTKLGVLSRSKKERNLKTELGKKVGKKIHQSSKGFIKEDLPYMKAMFENKEMAIQLTASLELNEEEIAYLLNTKPTTKKVEKMKQEAEELIKQKIRENMKMETKTEETKNQTTLAGFM